MPASSTIAGRPWLAAAIGQNGTALDAIRDRDEWVANRGLGLGGSDVAAIVGDPVAQHSAKTKTAIDVWLTKTTGVDTFRGNERTYMGNKLEPFVLDLFAAGGDDWPRDGGKIHLLKPPTVYHQERTWQRGSVDGLAYYPEVIAHLIGDRLSNSVDLLAAPAVPAFGVEVKTHGWFAGRSYAMDDDGAPTDIPEDKRVQCLWYSELYDLDRWVLVCLVDTHIRKTFVVHRDKQLGADLLTEAERFWRKHVLTGTPPDPDGTAGFGAYLKGKFAKHDNVIAVATAEVDAVVADFKIARLARKRLEAEEDRLEQTIKLAIGDHHGIDTAHGKITWSHRKSGKFRDGDLRQELFDRLGLTDAEIDVIKTKYEQPGHRAMGYPRWKE